MKLFIEYGHYFEYENHKGNFRCVLKDNFHGIDADITRGQDIYYRTGYTWRWEDNPRSEVFHTKQEAFNNAFEHLFVLCPKQDRTETIEQWQDYARDNGYFDIVIMKYLNSGE